MKSVTDYELSQGPVTLGPKKFEKIPSTNRPGEKTLNSTQEFNAHNGMWHFPNRFIRSQSYEYYKTLLKKSILVMRLFENRIGPGLLNQAVSKILKLAEKTCTESLENLINPEFKIVEKKNQFSIQSNYYQGGLTLESGQFYKACRNVSVREISDIEERWVNRGGVANLKAKYKFDKSRNTVDITIEQGDEERGKQIYRGPLSIRVQELDGSFSHTVNFEDSKDGGHDNPSFSLGCHSRSRAKKNKKIPLERFTKISEIR